MKSRLLQEIALNGPMPFERFMTEALYGKGGFFASSTLRSERGGDFLTSPEVSPEFGKTLGRWAASWHDRLGAPFSIVEVGAGSGSLLRSLVPEVPPDIEVVAVDASPAARQSLSAIENVTVLEDSADLPDRIRGVVIANELVDNLPMAVAQRVDGRWRERWVGADGQGLTLVDAPVRSTVAEWLERHAGPVDEGGWVEVQIVATEWMLGMLERISEGALLIIDYGDTKENLAPRRRDGTLRTYRAHHLGPHPLDEPGATDITADVNFSALLAAAQDAGHRAVLHRQDDFLAGWGLREMLSGLRHRELELARSGDTVERLRVRSERSEAETLLHPRGLGDFRVLEVVVLRA